MDRSLSELEAIVRNKICKVCTSRDVNGECGLEDPTTCALFGLFPQVARAVQRVKSDDIRDYIDAIREDVCSVCAQRAADGSCETREQVQCALDAYLLLVVEAIEEATLKKFYRKGLGAMGGGPLVHPRREARL